MRVHVEVISDVVCPWCYIGKRRLEAALRELSARQEDGTLPEVTVQWRPFELNPTLPQGGVARSEYVARKFGDRAQEIYGRLTQVGAEEHIPFAFDRIVRQPNTAAAHQLIALAHEEHIQDKVVEALFRAYFLEGADLTDTGVLVGIVQDAGLDAAAAHTCLADERARQAVVEEERAAHEMGVEGVPFFVFNRRFAVSGAQAPAVLLRALEAAVEAEAREWSTLAPSIGGR